MTTKFRRKCLHCEGRVLKADYESGTCRHCGKSFAALEKREEARLKRLGKSTNIKAGKVKAQKSAKQEQASALKLEEKKKMKMAELLAEAKASNVYEHICAYQIVGEKSAYSLAKQVRADMKNGWKPLGSMSVYNSGGRIGSVPDHFFQTMVKFKY